MRRDQDSAGGDLSPGAGSVRKYPSSEAATARALRLKPVAIVDTA
jgi:hypothetical protein